MDKPLTASQLHVDQVVNKLLTKHGAAQEARIKQGVSQVARFWRTSDGTASDFSAFCDEYFIAHTDTLNATFARFEANLEQIYGHNIALDRSLKEPMHLDIGPLYPVDMLFANYDAFVHFDEDMFQSKLAFVVLLNYPFHSLTDMLEHGAEWSREQWAEARLVKLFNSRAPSDIQQKVSEAYVSADNYISNYNIYMHRVLTDDGARLFPAGLKLISHWGLRDEIKAQYANKDGLERQKMIQTIMERIIRQDIPKLVINNPDVDWSPGTNDVRWAPEASETGTPSDKLEPNTRYQHLLSIFQAEKLKGPFYPETPTHMARKFELDREIPEAEFEQLLISVLEAPVAQKVASLIKHRLERPLEPFDIWYDGFKLRSNLDIAELDRQVARRYPTVQAFKDDLPFLLRNIGFDGPTANFLSSKIEIDPSRGAGHAMGAGMRSDNAHLRTRIPDSGMNYKGFNIAIHELGHNVEQVFSLNRMDHWLLQGVPNTAFTEGFAFVFQSRDLDLLGIQQNDPMREHMSALDNYWSTFEIASVALVDMYVWRWMYEHPKATPAQLNTAVQQIAKDVWNKYVSPVIGVPDQILLAVYSHMIDAGLYLPDYPLGYIIAFQVENYLKQANLATEMERMCRIGSVTPNEWMREAIGQPISSVPLIEAAEAAIAEFNK
ncbi:hypothetical protein JW960_18130 [candidate division KSB1 bacterium]|nr:hypothetical protein [candidate division KSB1 bacterium]